MKYIDQPLHPMYQVHKHTVFVITNLCLFFIIIPYAIYDKEDLDMSGSGFGLIMMFGMCMGFYWLAFLYEWIKVWTRSKN